MIGLKDEALIADPFGTMKDHLALPRTSPQNCAQTYGSLPISQWREGVWDFQSW